MTYANITAALGPSFHPFGDSALTIEFGEEIDTEVNEAVIRLGAAIQNAPFDGLVEVVPTYRSLLVIYDPLQTSGASVEKTIQAQLETLADTRTVQRQWEIPTWYGGEAALDLETLSQEKNMTPEQLIALHSGATYRVFMTGFSPGFAYLGGLPKALHTPRLPKPRQRVPAGAIGIGGQQASVNSVAGPSGWRFIGQTPVRAFDPKRAEPFLFAAGDLIRFLPVSNAEAQDLFRRVEAGEDIVQPKGHA